MIYLQQNFKKIQTNSYQNVPLSTKQSNYPLIVFEPEMGKIVFNYTVLAENLASEGYIVVAINPTYSSDFVVFNDRSFISMFFFYMEIKNIETLHCRTRVLVVCYNEKCNLGNQRGRCSMRTYSTSEIAKIMEIHPNTVMLYEKWGYIAPAPRKRNGYRVYTETHLEQMKLVRLALRSDSIKWYMKFEVQNIIRSAAQRDLKKALELSREYLTHIQNEKNNELKVMKVIQEILKSDLLTEKNISLNRNVAAKLLGVSINVIVYWERNGLLEVPRSKNGYRVYGEDEIKQLRIIKALRQENYSTQCIRRMLKKLKTKSKGNDMFLSEERSDSDDWLLSSLSETESNTKELIGYIGELISKKTEI